MTAIRIELDNQTDTPCTAADFQNLAGKIALAEGISGVKSLSLIFLGSEEMQKLNRNWRGKDSATDVLSFPCEFPESDFLGDIIIDTQSAASQKGTRTLMQEMQVLFIHGFLHLLGYDHLAGDDARIMEQKEIKYRSIIKENLVK